MNWKKILPLMGIVLLLATAGCIQEQQQSEQQGNEKGQENGAMATVQLKYTDAEGNPIAEKELRAPIGSNAWELMKQNMQVEFDAYDFGPFVKSIEGTAPPEGHYMALYVNGSYAEKGIGDYTISEGIGFEWKTEKLEDFGLE